MKSEKQNQNPIKKRRRLYQTTSDRTLCRSARDSGPSLHSSPPCRHFEVADREANQMDRFLFISDPAGLGLVAGQFWGVAKSEDTL